MENLSNRLTSLTLILSASPLLAPAQEPGGSMKTIQAARAEGPIVIDGLLDEAVWANAAVAEDIHQ